MPLVPRLPHAVVKLAGLVLILVFVVSCGSGGEASTGRGNADVADGGSKFTTADEEQPSWALTQILVLSPRANARQRCDHTLEKKPSRIVIWTPN